VADPADIAHLLRRTEFVAKTSRMAELTPLSIAQAVDNILDIGVNGAPTLPDYLKTDDRENRWEQYEFAYYWWATEMLNRPKPIAERMTLFWHGHFVSSLWDGVDRVDLMMRQNQLYRDHALGNFFDLTHKMSLEPAMLLYLSNANNVKGSPNENFARELMELFTLGVGNYSEDDVAAAARAWTGHNYDSNTGQYLFRPTRHDTGNKTFFGTTKNWDGPDIINEILRDNAGKRLIAARFITKKLWDQFAHPGAPANVVNELADVFLANNFEVMPLMRALLNRPEFYSEQAKQGLVRTPTEYAIAVMYYTGQTAQSLGLSWRSESMGQILFNPPNVAGWKANSYWLNTSALSGRANLAKSVANTLRKNGGFDFIYTMATDAAVDHVANYLGITNMSSVTRNALIAAHQAEKNTTKGNEWWAPTNLLTMALICPEFHMA
jgi:uncharacterized protein (DUF1800 family)